MSAQNLRLLLDESVYGASNIYPLSFDQGKRQAYYLRQGDKKKNEAFLDHWEELKSRVAKMDLYPVLVPEPDFVVNFPATESFCQRLSTHYLPDELQSDTAIEADLPFSNQTQFQDLVEVLSQERISLVQVNKWLRRLYPQVFISLKDHPERDKIIDEQLAYTKARCHIAPKREAVLESIEQNTIKHRFHLEYYLLRWEAAYKEEGHEAPSLVLPEFNVPALASQERLGQNVLLLPKGSVWNNLSDIYRYLLDGTLTLPEALVMRGLESQFETKMVAVPFLGSKNILLRPKYKPQKLKYAFVIATFFETIYGETYRKKGILVRELARQWFDAPLWVIDRQSLV